MPSPMQSSDVRTEDASATDLGKHLDMATFEQILNFDDDDSEREFSKGLVYDFFAQAETTFHDMDLNLKSGNLAKVSMLGHFLKGSSATLGLTKLMASCDKIERIAGQKDRIGTEEGADNEKIFESCKELVERAKSDFYEVEAALKRFYHDG